MFGTFFRFEIRFWLRGMMVYIFTLIIALLIFGATTSDRVVVGSAAQVEPGDLLAVIRPSGTAASPVAAEADS